MSLNYAKTVRNWTIKLLFLKNSIIAFQVIISLHSVISHLDSEPFVMIGKRDETSKHFQLLRVKKYCKKYDGIFGYLGT